MRQRKSERFAQNLHGGRRSHKLAGTAGRAGIRLTPRIVFLRHVAFAVFDADVADLLKGKAVGRRRHDTARHMDRRKIESCHGHEVRRYAFIAARNQQHPVKNARLGMDLRHAGNNLTGHERIVHAVMSLSNAVAHIRHRVMRRLGTGIFNAVVRHFGKPCQMHASRMAVSVGGIDQPERSYGPMSMPSTPSTSKISSMFSTASLDSIITMTVISSFAPLA